MNTQIKTKIVCTIGPSSWDEDILAQMATAGMTIARINGAYGDLRELGRVGDTIRKVSNDIALMLDIKGTEVRLNKFKNPIKISVGDTLTIGHDKTDMIFPITYPDLYTDLKIGSYLLIDDGRVKLQIKEIKDKKIICTVIYGEEIKPGKTINTPGVALTNPPITKKDITQINFAVEKQWDFIAASFVRSKADILEVKKHIGDSDIKIIAKIEDPQGIENLEEIIQISDGIIVARGDLGVEIPFAQVPIVQKQIVESCLDQAKPVIVATQMLESMVNSPKPTRAEVNDVSNSILDGADCVWLSAETSTGKYPVKAVETLNLIAQETEKYIDPEVLDTTPYKIDPMAVSIAKGVVAISSSPTIDKIIVVTHTGDIARVISSYKPTQEIITLTSSNLYKNQLLATSGVTPYLFDTTFSDNNNIFQNITSQLLELKIIKATDMIVIAKDATLSTNDSNTIKIGLAGDITRE